MDLKVAILCILALMCSAQSGNVNDYLGLPMDAVEHNAFLVGSG